MIYGERERVFQGVARKITHKKKPRCSRIPTKIGEEFVSTIRNKLAPFLDRNSQAFSDYNMHLYVP